MAVGGERYYMYPTYPTAAEANHQIRAHIDELTSTAGSTAAVVCPQTLNHGIEVFLNLFGTSADRYTLDAVKIVTSFRKS